MAPKHARLGNFFPNDSGVKSAAPQQSKLTFSVASKLELKSDAESNEADNGSQKAAESAEQFQLAQTGLTGDHPLVNQAGCTKLVDAKVEHEDEKIKLSTNDSSIQTPRNARKREIPNPGSPSAEEEQPPNKKSRTKSTSTDKTFRKTVINDRALKRITKDSAESKMKVEEAGKTSERIIHNVPSNAQRAESARPVRKQHRDAGEEELSLSRTTKKAAVVAVSMQDDSDSAEISELYRSQEQEEDSDDANPALATKAREKVHSSLVGKSKDPYPDWKPGEPVPFAALCTTFSKIELTAKRLEIQAHCCLFLCQVLRLTPQDLLPTIQLMVNKLAADYTGIELGIGESLIMKAIGETTGRSLPVIKTDQNEIGDLGLVAAKSRSNQPTMFKPKPLTIRGVHDGLMAIATVDGQGAQGRKVGGIKKLLSSADAHLLGKGSKGVDITKDMGGPSEAKFIIRALEGKMRLGLADKTVLISLAQAMVTHESSQKNRVATNDQLARGESILKSVYSELPSYEVIIPVMLEHGLANLHDKCKLQPGIPLKPMLAKPTKSITEVLDRFEGKHFSCEYKYDGERAQIHFVAHDSSAQYASTAPTAGKSEKGISNIFSRNSEDLSKKYPDILAKLPTWIKKGTKSFVLDCETVGWDVIEKKVLPFQTLMTRKRKDVKVEDIKVKVCVFAFDVLFLNGEALVNKSFRERRDHMRSAFMEVEGEFAFAKYGNTNELEEIQTLLEESVKASCEGLMVKMLDGVESNYEPSRRSQNWLKVKKDYLSGVGDSLDLVVLGAYFGKGKRTSVYGAFLLACYNPSSEIYETVCNIGTGFSEVVLESLHDQLSPLIIDRPKPFYSHSQGNKDQPDVWFEAKFVWEVLCADLTLSPRYKAAAQQMEGGKGVSLRFPRFLRVRDDKKAGDATTSRAIAEMYRKQEGVAKSKGPAVDDDFEY